MPWQGSDGKGHQGKQRNVSSESAAQAERQTQKKASAPTECLPVYTESPTAASGVWSRPHTMPHTCHPCVGCVARCVAVPFCWFQALLSNGVTEVTDHARRPRTRARSRARRFAVGTLQHARLLSAHPCSRRHDDDLLLEGCRANILPPPPRSFRGRGHSRWRALPARAQHSG